jgi:mevalonate kinase
MITIEIRIPIASTWPTREELGARNAVEASLNAAGIGKVTGAGGGMGSIDLAYRVDDEAKITAAKAAIDEAMKTHMASFRYQVAVL